MGLPIEYDSIELRNLEIKVATIKAEIWDKKRNCKLKTIEFTVDFGVLDKAEDSRD